MKAISIKQPWAYLIAAGIKDIENRTWKCPQKYIGERVLIHASAKPAKIDFEINGQATVMEIQLYSALNKCDENGLFSAIIGSVEIVDCVVNHTSIWAEKSIDCKDGGPDVESCPIGRCPHLIYNWVLANPILFDKPINAKGRLSFWEFDRIKADKDENEKDICMCNIGVDEKDQVLAYGNGDYRCRYCGGRWSK